MASFMKYRVHEVAKDFGLNSKDISEILRKYATAPKNHMQVLEEAELNIIFEYLTRHNQIALKRFLQTRKSRSPRRSLPPPPRREKAQNRRSRPKRRKQRKKLLPQLRKPGRQPSRNVSKSLPKPYRRKGLLTRAG
jgi:translation initiation factor IF-2